MKQESTTAIAAGSSGGVFDPHWWVRALALHERPAWGGAHEVAPDEEFRRANRPAWADVVERVALAVEAEPPADWGPTLAEPLRPFVADACARLLRHGKGRIPAQLADLVAIVDGFAVQLGRRLAQIATPILDSAEQARASVAQLAGKYPVLARLLGQASQLAIEMHLELLTRYVTDREQIIDTLFGGTNPGPLVAVGTGQGDAHRRGRSVSLLRFADGRQIIYKPRSLQTQGCFGSLIRWLNGTVPGLELQVVGTVSRDGYGWMEFLRHRPLRNLNEAARFYRRQGALLALLHAVRATDAHYENLIAVGDQPVLVDAETLFQPSLPVPAVAPDPAAHALAESVHRTALLSSLVVADDGVRDVSGLGGDERVGASVVNRPRLAGHRIDPADHEPALLEGFRLAYNAIMRNRHEFRRLVATFADIEIRVVVRPTRLYAHVLAEATRPDFLGDGGDQDRVLLDQLWQASPCPTLRRLVPHEVQQLREGDIPLFVGYPSSPDVWTADRQQVSDLFERPGLSMALDRVDVMDEADRQDQEWIISATLASRRASADPHTSRQTVSAPVAASAVPDPESLLTAACGLADQIVARSMTDRTRVNWLGLELVDGSHWLVLPMGAGLASGYCGVALFLAQLGEITGVARYQEVARRAVSVVPQLFESLAPRPDLVQTVGCGGFHGFGGVGYALARIATLLADADIRQAAATAVELAGIAAGSPGPPGVAWGTAGCLAAMHAVHLELKLEAAAQLAELCADRLVRLVADPDGQWAEAEVESLTTGFADGAAGIGWALARYASSGGGSRYIEAGRALLSRVGPRFSRRVKLPRSSWCSGEAGLMAALIDANEVSTTETQAMAATLAERPVRHDLSLCHGELGIVESLTLLAQRDRSVVKVRQRRAGMVLDAIARYGPRCGVPGAVPTPGLLTGLAGIGYGLMRLGFAERVPSVLLLEPTPSHVGDSSSLSSRPGGRERKDGECQRR